MRQRRAAGGGVARWWDWRSQRRVWVAAALVTGAVPVLIAYFSGITLAAGWAPVATALVSVLGLLVNVGKGGGGDEGPRAEGRARLDQATEDLALAVREQWLAEARVRRLQDPEPLNVRWAVADPALTDHWDNIIRRTGDSLPTDFTGRLDGIVEVFAKVPSRRMVILGRPGAGKTVLAIRFTLDMLARRAPQEPVPVIFPVSTWDPAHHSLREWVAERLAADFSSLGAISSSGRTLASDLLGSHRVLPVLDGLDELPEPLCGAALRRLNAGLNDDTPVVVTCRTEVYAQIVASGDVLTSALAVELLPLTLEESGRYLQRTARPLPRDGGTSSETIWGPVLRRLHQHPDHRGAAALREVLSTPLMTAMARSVYSDTGRDPTELLHKRFGSPASIEEHLLDAFIPAVFDETVTDGEEVGRSAWTADQVRKWLGFLARHLERRNTVNLAWWELETALPTLLRRLAPGMLAGCLTAAVIVMVLALFLYHVLINHWDSGTVLAAGALALGGVTGLTAGLTVLGRRRTTSARGSTRKSRSFLGYQAAVALAMAVFLGVALGAVADLTSGLDLTHLRGYFPSGLLGLLAGAAISVVFGTSGVSGRPVPLTVPWAKRTRKRPLAWRITVTAASFLFGYLLSQRTNTGNIELSHVIPVLAGAVFGAAAWSFTALRKLTPPAKARSSRRMLHRFNRDFTRGLLRCFATCLFFGLVLGTVGGAIAGWRTKMNDGFPAGSTVTTAPNGTRTANNRDGWTYTIASDGTKTAKPPHPVPVELIENLHRIGRIPLSNGSSIRHKPPTDRWAADPTRQDDSDPKLCEDAPSLRCTKFASHVRFQSKGGRTNVIFLDGHFSGQVVEAHNLAERVFPKAVDWFEEQKSWNLLLEGLQLGLIGGLTLGGIGGITCGLYRWLETPADITRSTSPLSSLKTDQIATLTHSGLAMALSGLVCFLIVLTTRDLDGSHGIAGQLWLAIGPVAACLSAWGQLLTARIWLSATGQLPWRLMTFLSEAHRRGVLRQSGALYQFRHLRLQQQLAANPTGERDTSRRAEKSEIAT